jgi:hypothetical protein
MFLNGAFFVLSGLKAIRSRPASLVFSLEKTFKSGYADPRCLYFLGFFPVWVNGHNFNYIIGLEVDYGKTNRKFLDNCLAHVFLFFGRCF